MEKQQNEDLFENGGYFTQTNNKTFVFYYYAPNSYVFHNKQYGVPDPCKDFIIKIILVPMLQVVSSFYGVSDKSGLRVASLNQY